MKSALSSPSPKKSARVCEYTCYADVAADDKKNASWPERYSTYVAYAN